MCGEMREGEEEREKGGDEGRGRRGGRCLL